jgi:hypothetical protein
MDHNEYIVYVEQANTLKELGDAPVEFELWCVWKHHQIRIKTKTVDSKHDPDIGEVSARLTTYAPDLSWSISESLLIAKELKKQKAARQHWYNAKHMEAVSVLKTRGNNSPAVKTIEAYIEQEYHEDYSKWSDILDDLDFKQQSLEKHLTLWMKMDKVYSSLMYDINAEFYRTYKQHKAPSSSSYDPDKELEDFIKKGLPEHASSS